MSSPSQDRPPGPGRGAPARRSGLVVALAAVLAVSCACSTASSGRPDSTAASLSPAASSGPPSPVTSSSSAPSPAPTTSRPTPAPTSGRTVAKRASTPKPTPTPTALPARVPAISGPASGPVIVLDPGHAPTITATDPATGLNVSDYENEPEMRDVFAVAELVRTRLLAAGYRVVMTKTHVRQRLSLAQRAAIAHAVHAALAISIHDQAGSNGGIGFRAGNNIVYYQSVGTYRATAKGKKIYFTDAALAATSKRYGQIFRAQRSRVEGVPITLQGNTGYNLGSRGLAAGNIWTVQLLSGVPWIYNESGGNSAGRSGLSPTDKATYAAALVAGVEHSVPLPG